MLIPIWPCEPAVELRGRGEARGRAGTAPGCVPGARPGIAAWLAAVADLGESMDEGRGAMGWKALFGREGLPEDFYETEPEKDHISERPLHNMHGNDKSQKTQQASAGAPPLVGDIYF
ncbi:hypothetical protein CNMCM6106_007109 [Aspergillus hiratsukae]|uniref:Uncharacterized protein n=1 Tax=Aspergillus hiratsukae TaxID=1194566 RepID=A0A8H6QFQ7_9EURO|nr:hypothetical protein CNMCM6106_007109 [Aspergillus hiratsukae]